MPCPVMKFQGQFPQPHPPRESEKLLAGHTEEGINESLHEIYFN